MDTSVRILITGAAGFMGSHIVDALIKAGYNKIYGVDDLSGGDLGNLSKYVDCKNPHQDIVWYSAADSMPLMKHACLPDSPLEFYEADLSLSCLTEHLIKKVKPDIIFHLAANAREGASFFQPLNIVQRNYLAYMNVLEPAIEQGLDKVILYSSMAVYGNQRAPFSEEMPRTPVDIYGINKAAMEHTTELLSEVHGFRYTIIRPHNVFGSRQSLRDPYRNVIGIFMNRILRREPLYIYGDGEQMRAFSYIEDSLPCYVKCIEKADGEIINIGGTEAITINKLVELVSECMGIRPYPAIEHLKDRHGEVKVAYCTYQKSISVLGYRENVGHVEGIKKMAAWVKEKGAQEWSEEKLTLWNEKAPSVWR